MAMMEHYLNYFWSWAITHKILSLGAIIAAYLAFYSLGLIIYRLAFSNLSGFPGPKIAAATYWYEHYYEVVWQGKYYSVVEEMHRKYGIASKAFL